MRHARLLPLPFVALALAACQPSAPPPADAPAEASAAAADGRPAPDAPGEALLEADGVTPANPGGRGTALKFAFGMPEADVVSAMSQMRGGQAPTRGANAECPVGPLTFADWGDDLQFVFADGRLAGWTAGDGAPRGFTTLAGIGVGSTVAELKAAYPEAQIREDSIGPEFAAGEIYGTLSGTGDDARVTGLWAGASCIFR
ncbi:MAG: hypothetical protein H2038_11280 [Brevundimonas sp.]|jgi:hypothetical protein|uniref:hypothetical protein n=1 Tax=Brevundimonas sp. TaxID=1871086 RepID=UPI00179A5141|nr:hypothetical protein [Brevundimonas sp.]MBA4805224.1 hypothetical protein [Brevundimonas sp.]